VDATLALATTIAPQEVIATQQGIAADLQGAGCWLWLSGSSRSEASWCGVAAVDPKDIPRE